ncbi:MuDRA-like transposase [Cucumis melo var. makuwa]|uniref:MuDRA-like transposase n=1 Tax=Cucumis melo var. makuwa TaxID=1194695 RepID=A0A5A7VJH9_CUCMM|nr:MuDRA-like transposase [Cucumis melo var. makuwa]
MLLRQDVSDVDVNTRPETNIEFIDIDHIPMAIEVQCTFSVQSSEEGRRLVSPRESYALLARYGEVSKISYFDSQYDLEIEPDYHFKYVYMALGASIRGFLNYIRLVIVVDVAHCKGKYKSRESDTCELARPQTRTTCAPLGTSWSLVIPNGIPKTLGLCKGPERLGGSKGVWRLGWKSKDRLGLKASVGSAWNRLAKKGAGAAYGGRGRAGRSGRVAARSGSVFTGLFGSAAVDGWRSTRSGRVSWGDATMLGSATGAAATGELHGGGAWLGQDGRRKKPTGRCGSTSDLRRMDARMGVDRLDYRLGLVCNGCPTAMTGEERRGGYGGSLGLGFFSLVKMMVMVH